MEEKSALDSDDLADTEDEEDDERCSEKMQRKREKKSRQRKMEAEDEDENENEHESKNGGEEKGKGKGKGSENEGLEVKKPPEGQQQAAGQEDEAGGEDKDEAKGDAIKVTTIHTPPCSEHPADDDKSLAFYMPPNPNKPLDEYLSVQDLVQLMLKNFMDETSQWLAQQEGTGVFCFQ